jgi:signal transduction histidine kinase
MNTTSPHTEQHPPAATPDIVDVQLRRNRVERDRMQAILISTLQSLTDGVLAVGQDGIIIVANPAACAMLDRPLEDLAGCHIETVLPEGAETAELLLTLQGVGGRRGTACWPRTEPDGRARRLDLTAVRALPPYDLHLAGLILLEDTTELRRLETQARLRSRLTGMGEIAMNLAHEIRNPLGSIVLFADTLRQDLADRPELAQLAGQIAHGVKALEHLVANTLEFAKPRRLSMARVRLNDAIHDALVYVQHPLAQHDIRVRYDHDLQPDAWISGDGEQLRQVFLNLFLNAIQAMENGGTLRISIHAASVEPDCAGIDVAGWRVAVADDGIGIPDELHTRIFDPFFTTRDKGSGLGLAVVHRILSAHGARIELRSRVAAGACFEVTFPVAVETADAVDTPDSLLNPV